MLWFQIQGFGLRGLGSHGFELYGLGLGVQGLTLSSSREWVSGLSVEF